MIYTSREVYEYISKKIGDPIIEWKTCAVSGTQFPIYESDYNFYNKISPTFAGTKFQISVPTLCSEERERRRLAFRNERTLYKRKCDASGESILSIYSPDKEYIIYNQKFRWSDAWDPLSYGTEFDFSKSFTEQFGELMKAVPRPNLCAFDCNNCNYTNEVISCNNCYLIISGVENNGCMYCQYVDYCSNCMDCLMLYKCELCYDCYNTKECYNCTNSSFLLNCTDCTDCHYCNGVSNCYGCYGIANKQYCINNIQYTISEYENQLGGELSQIISSGPKFYNQYYNENCEQCCGNFLYNCKNITFSENIQNAQDCKYCLRGAGMNDCMDCFINGVVPNSLFYECMTVGPGTHNLFCSNSRPNVNDCYYVDQCSNSSNLFGCIGLRNKSYCIFNKQYTQDEYEKIIRKLIEHMQDTGERGEFFHPSLSPFGYNETVAQEYYPEKAPSYQHPAPSPAVGAGSKLVAGSRQLGAFGYKRSTYSADPKIPDGAKTIKPQDYTQEEWKVLRDTPDITKQIIICEVSHRPFLLQKAEIEFYQKHNLPIPTKHPDIRHEERMKLRPGRTLHLRNCDKCGKEMLSIVASKKYLVTSKDDIDDTSSSLLDTSYSVYCETCYKQEVYG